MIGATYLEDLVDDVRTFRRLSVSKLDHAKPIGVGEIEEEKSKAKKETRILFSRFSFFV